MFQNRLLPMYVAVAACTSFCAQAQGQVSSASKEKASSPVVLDEVLVIGVQQAELNAREMEYDTETLSSVIAQDDAGNFADQNVAESLQRLPGIALEKTEGEGRFVSVRGLAPSFVSVNMNGSEMASALTDSRAFALDSIPSDLVGSIEVYKTLTPDMDLSSIAGSVNVNSISAFSYNRNSLKLSAQAFVQDYAGATSPRISLKGTNLLADNTWGIGYALSREKRETQVYENLHHSSNSPRVVQAQLPGQPSPDQDTDAALITPYQYEVREENAERTRTAGSFDIEFRPSEQHSVKLVLSRAEFEDEDVAVRETYRFDSVLADQVAFIDSNSSQFGVVNAQLQQQYFIQQGKSVTTNFAISGSSFLTHSLELDYKYSKSKAEFDKPGGRRTQFRAQRLAMLGGYGAGAMSGSVVTSEELLAAGSIAYDDPSFNGAVELQSVSPANLHYDNTFIEDSFREDEIDEISLNLKQEFANDFVGFVKAGIRLKNRSRTRNKDRQSFNIDSVNCVSAECAALLDEYNAFGDAYAQSSGIAFGGNLDNFATYTPDHPDFQYQSITRVDSEALLAVSAPLGRFAGDTGLNNVDSTKDDYSFEEDTSAAYLMAAFNLGSDASVIVGGRYEQTDLFSGGYFSIDNDGFYFNQASSAALDIAVPISDSNVTYSDFMPSIHFRYEPLDELLVRAAAWTSFTRPSFQQSRSFAKTSGNLQLCVPGTERQENGEAVAGTGECGPNINADYPDVDLSSYVLGQNTTLEVGNPSLAPMTATNFDLNVSWSSGPDLFLQAALFYKDIEDFIVDVTGATVASESLPVTLPLESVSEFVIPNNLIFNKVNYTANGDYAEVYGVELSYSQYFKKGLFLQSNLTLLDSEAVLDSSVRADKISLPGQADETFNLTLGWDNNEFSVRLIANYRSDILLAVGGCSESAAASIAAGQLSAVAGLEACRDWADIYEDATFGLDLKATYNVTDRVRVYFDAINLTEDDSLSYFKGNSYSSGNMLYARERFGSSYQMGLNIDLY